MNKQLIGAAIIILTVVVGCQQKGPAEKAGERIDEAVDNVQHGDFPLKHKGPMEKAGESVDDAVKKLDRKIP